MSAPQARRITRELTPEEKARVARNQTLIADELPDLARARSMRKEASDEATLSGDLRRAIHASQLSLSAIAAKLGFLCWFSTNS
jgi:hypothetical protein